MECCDGTIYMSVAVVMANGLSEWWRYMAQLLPGRGVRGKDWLTIEPPHEIEIVISDASSHG